MVCPWICLFVHVRAYVVGVGIMPKMRVDVEETFTKGGGILTISLGECMTDIFPQLGIVWASSSM